MKIPVVKEWGSWIVFVLSCFAALISGLKTRDITGGDYVLRTVTAIVGMALLINAKNPMASAVRTRGRNREKLLWFLLFSIAGLILVHPVFVGGTEIFTLSLFLVSGYVIMLVLGKEHSVFAEYTGFALLTLSGPIVFFAITGEISWRLYIAVLMFFGAGVFKVRVRLQKTLIYRSTMALYVASAIGIFYCLDMPVLTLLPLSENLVSVVLMREEKLRTTGYIEMTKGIIFLILIGLAW